MKNLQTIINKLLWGGLIAASALLFTFCGGNNSSENTPKTNAAPKAEQTQAADPMSDKGIGPIKEVKLGAINDEMVKKGQEIFKAKCTACHKIEKKYIGPALRGVTERVSPEWIMNMILNPEQMVKENPIAKQLFAEFSYVPMANQNLTKDEARLVLEYFRTLKSSTNK